MLSYDVVLLTEDRYFEPLQITHYIENILLDDTILTKELESMGLTVTRRSWSDKTFDWSNAKFAIFRTTWDYFTRFSEFTSWLEATSKKTTFINSVELVRWNMDKHYFNDLNKKNIHTVETLFIEKGDKRSLENIFNNLNAGESIIKPAISGTARHTYRLNKTNLREHEGIFSKLIAEESMLIQPFQTDILHKGEVAMMVIGGKFTHAVLKKARAGDFRVQDDFGGTLHDYIPASREIEFAEAAVQACENLPVYARVDIIHDNHKQLAIMELEIIEPEMWFRRSNYAAALFAKEINKLCSA